MTARMGRSSFLCDSSDRWPSECHTVEWRVQQVRPANRCESHVSAVGMVCDEE